jgi:hypothetical protein
VWSESSASIESKFLQIEINFNQPSQLMTALSSLFGLGLPN